MNLYWITVYYSSIFNPFRLKVKAMKAELPVRSGEQKFTLLWDEGATRTFQFDRLSREPKLGTAEPATGVSLVPVPGSKVPRLPMLLPEVKR